jgi:hypothetical protein
MFEELPNPLVKSPVLTVSTMAGWWSQTFFIFHNIWDNPDNPSH